MLGLIIGDLAAWTWQHRKQVFYRNLFSPDAVLSEVGQEALSIVEPILSHSLDKLPALQDKRLASLYLVEIGWCSSSQAEAVRYARELQDKFLLDIIRYENRKKNM